MGEPNWTNLLRRVTEAGIAEAILRRLGELIGSGVLRPGDRLPSEQELARYLGVAPMTVRNALQVMRNQGILITTRGRGAGTFVAPNIHEKLWYRGNELPTIAAVSDFTTWRVAISGECCAIVAVTATADEVAELQRLQKNADEEGLSGEAYRFADAALHLKIAELAGSQRLLEAEQQIQDYLTRVLGDGGPRTDPDLLNAQHHAGIIGAIAARDPEEARRKFGEHARATLDLMIGVGRVRVDGDSAQLGQT